MKTILLAATLTAIVVILSTSGNSSQGVPTIKGKSQHLSHAPEPSVNKEYHLPYPASAAVGDSFVLASYTFETGPEGWVGVDNSLTSALMDTFFHVDSVAAQSGSQSLWCGAMPGLGDPLCGYKTLPGYGNNWHQLFESIDFPVAGDITLQYDVRYETELDFDFCYVEYLDKNDEWSTLRSYDGVADSSETLIIPAADLGAQTRIRFVVISDRTWSDEDGKLNTDCGAMIIDDLRVEGLGAPFENEFQDFEAESIGALSTVDGHWFAKVPDWSFGDYSGIVDGDTVVQEDPLVTNTTRMWTFFNDSPDDYACGGFPDQAVVPYGPNDDGLYLWNEIWSPVIDWAQDTTGTPVPISASSLVLEFDVYYDMTANALVFLQYLVRTRVNECWEPWYCDNRFLYGGKYWKKERRYFTNMIPPQATDIQVALRCVDTCPYFCGIYGDGSCHSHGPLIDNVRLVRLAGPPCRFYVYEDATGANDGTSWANAFTDLQSALQQPYCGATEIWVAQGTYKPSLTEADQSATFQLSNGVAIYGGFAGSETSLSERHLSANTAILSGDIGMPEVRTDNSYHVVTGSGTDSTAVLDGFTITGGYAHGGRDDDAGGGLINVSGSPTLSNLIFVDNFAYAYGGGIYNYIGSSPTLTNVVFSGDSVEWGAGGGGGMCNSMNSNPTLTNVTFWNNVATYGYGGAVFNYESAPVLVNTILWGNTDSKGYDQIYNNTSMPLISYSLVEGSGGSSGWDIGLGTDGGNNIDANPLFVDAANGNLRLMGTSPAIDTGNNEVVPLNSYDLDGNPRLYGGTVDMGAYEYTTLTAIGDPGDRLPATYALHQNAPNPFNPTTVIRYDVPAGGGHVTLRIYDVTGRLVRTLVDSDQTAGEKRVTWDGRNARGRQVATGVYFYRMTAPGFGMTKKMVMLQ